MAKRYDKVNGEPFERKRRNVMTRQNQIAEMISGSAAVIIGILLIGRLALTANKRVCT
jgi:hypothetical protein